LGCGGNRYQPPHAHGVARHLREPQEPVHTSQAPHLDLPLAAILLGPAKDTLDELAFLLTDGAPRIGPFGRVQAVLGPVRRTLGVLRDVRRNPALAQRRNNFSS